MYMKALPVPCRHISTFVDCQVSLVAMLNNTLQSNVAYLVVFNSVMQTIY